MYELAIGTFGFLLGLVPAWLQRKHRLRAHWCALRADITLCANGARALIDDRVAAPLYRLPVIAYHTSYPVLLADGAVLESEVLTLGKFFSLAQGINRGLDNSAHISLAESDKNEVNPGQSVVSSKLQSEHDRNCLKAKQMVDVSSKPSLAQQALAVVDARISQKWWQYARNP